VVTRGAKTPFSTLIYFLSLFDFSYKFSFPLFLFTTPPYTPLFPLLERERERKRVVGKPFLFPYFFLFTPSFCPFLG
jgi:hypothetical protein